MDRVLMSSHKLLSDYSLKGKLKNIIIGWVIFLVLLGITRLPVVRDALTSFSKSVTVDWVTSVVNFILNGFWVFGILLVIGTVVTLVKKQVFDEIRLYDTGVGFWDSHTGTERYAAYPDVKLSYGKMRQSFWVESKSAPIKLTEYAWTEFAQPDLLQANLVRYATWAP